MDHKISAPERFAANPLFTGLQCGMNFGAGAGRGYYSRPDVLQQPELMKQLGVNLVVLDTTICQENYYSRKMFLDFTRTPGEVELAGIIKKFHAQGIRVILRPNLISLDGIWKSRIFFREDHQIQEVNSTFQNEWIQSYFACLNYYADFAEAQKVDALLLGSTTFYLEIKDDPWINAIRAVRERYSGPISYELFPDSFFHLLNWYKELDFLSVSFFPFMPQENAVTTEQMIAAFQPGVESIQKLSAQLGGKPILLTSTGAPSLRNHIHCPYSFANGVYYDKDWRTYRYVPGTEADPAEQAQYLDAMLRSFSKVPQWMGLCWWKWDETSPFSLAGKTAEKIYVDWAENATNKGDN